MIKFERNRQQTIPESAVKIVGLGGAGANMLDRVALDGIEGAELLALNTDIRTLASSVAGEKIQLGVNLTKGLGSGGDPELGENSILEAEAAVRDALRDRKIVFICVGLGGGTGSGAAPIVVRLAREAGAFVVVFATMPFGFEGRRRREQAEESLNQLAVLANALVTFDNGRMGELVLPKDGVHEAFSAADRMISDSITAVARLVLRPGLINVGLDELMSALKTTRSRCLFGSGLARGENRAQGALKSALNSPLLDRGSLLEDATTVLVHVCGGDDMTLFEIEILMEGLTKHLPEDAHVLFGAATDSAMADALSVTVISALPEDRLKMIPIADLPEVKEVKPVVEEVEEPEPEPEVEEVFISEEEIEEIGLEGELEAEEEEEIALEAVEEEAETEEELIEETFEAELEPEEDFTTPELRIVEDDDIPDIEEEVEVQVEEVAEVQDEPEEEIFEVPAAKKGQGELELEGGPKGRFAGEDPNVEKGEDLDVPPYLRRRGRL
ncbi:cell division FtsZ family protein [Akkermansiaceae bacterium]|nr:cell division FtsZ family protein [Akkermansiaceae bacterium]MDA8980877.1 cell division FtsZ family protein [bacterium]MDB4421672.1 cell division FtsZ family protein [Akkermansiaceae bacterium]MDB4508969.1 cell division FtsZ family protein [Akkermansiaceae bacterium]MDB4545468.1 cell division FtsZ family protein [Akkermansiaceae bacterium]